MHLKYNTLLLHLQSTLQKEMRCSRLIIHYLTDKETFTTSGKCFDMRSVYKTVFCLIDLSFAIHQSWFWGSLAWYKEKRLFFLLIAPHFVNFFSWWPDQLFQETECIKFFWVFDLVSNNNVLWSAPVKLVQILGLKQKVFQVFPNN